ncbi:UNVERIFIED_CONTAM: hypothetical protein FKN15_037333 [Acipenser sinensis]
MEDKTCRGATLDLDRGQLSMGGNRYGTTVGRGARGPDPTLLNATPCLPDFKLPRNTTPRLQRSPASAITIRCQCPPASATTLRCK